MLTFTIFLVSCIIICIGTTSYMRYVALKFKKYVNNNLKEILDELQKQDEFFKDDNQQ